PHMSIVRRAGGVGATRLILLMLLGLAGGASALLAPGPSTAQDGEDGVGSGTPHNRYIVVLKEDAGDVSQRAAELGQAHGLTLGWVSQGVLRGCVAPIPRQSLAAVSHDPRVAYVERDGLVHAFAAFPVPTGVDRIDADASATAKIDGEEDRIDVDVAIIDSG